jgi:hypothetical protein
MRARPAPQTPHEQQPGSVVIKAYEGVAAGMIEILADDMTQGLKLQLSMKAEEFYPWLHGQLRTFVP